MTAAWVWKKETLVDTGGVVRDWRSHPQLQRTLICEECYEGAIRDGGVQTDEGWWIFDAEYVRSPRGQRPGLFLLRTQDGSECFAWFYLGIRIAAAETTRARFAL